MISVALAATAVIAGVAAPAFAQTYPSRPVKMVVPFAPGGATDIIARTVAQKLSDRLGQSVVIENKPGAGTTVGNAEVAKAKPDGYTLLFAPTPFVISQVVYPTLPYDPRKDFTPVSLLATSPFILVTNLAVPAQSIAELVALAKAKPGTLTFCSAGNGTVPHLAGELFKLRAGVDIVHVPYKGGGPAIVDLVGGQVNMMFATPIEVSQHVQAGKLRVLGATSRQAAAGVSRYADARGKRLPRLRRRVVLRRPRAGRHAARDRQQARHRAGRGDGASRRARAVRRAECRSQRAGAGGLREVPGRRAGEVGRHREAVRRESGLSRRRLPPGPPGHSGPAAPAPDLV